MKPSRASVKQKMAMEMKHANKNHISVKRKKTIKKKAEECLKRVQASERKQERRANDFQYVEKTVIKRNLVNVNGFLRSQRVEIVWKKGQRVRQRRRRKTSTKQTQKINSFVDISYTT